jgi:hypothetical protein
MGYRVKRKCIWCGAVKEPYAVRQKGESVLAYIERQLGPALCSAPDGDGHMWHPLHDVEKAENGN